MTQMINDRGWDITKIAVLKPNISFEKSMKNNKTGRLRSSIPEFQIIVRFFYQPETFGSSLFFI
ncbi:hypothetical protein CEF21_00905 [Bacillus sp. FJAT-42376]|nr:hypothetical protein CEF21_00905 [Bacillus sp. FJAT-42376]